MSLSPPPPPPGPGVHPPFPAPPVEGRGKRIGTGLGIAAGVVLLVCGVGTVAGVGFLTSATSAVGEQAEVTVSRFLDELRERDFDGAYQQLCQATRDEESQADFAARMAGSEPIRSYRVGEFDLVRGSVPVDLTYADGDLARVEAELRQSRTTGKFEVCDLRE